MTLTGERIGLALRARVGGQDVIALVSTYPAGNEQTQMQKMLHEVEDQISWAIWGMVVVLCLAIIATRRALAPLDRLSLQAAQISPTETDQRLGTGRVPAEFTPLIDAVNSAFDRLEAGYQAQRDFSSNVAHEIRTPLAVLRSTIDRIDSPDIRESLSQDAALLDQMFQQLIDLARADAALRSSFAPVELRDLVVEVARDMAQEALRAGHCQIRRHVPWGRCQGAGPPRRRQCFLYFIQ